MTASSVTSPLARPSTAARPPARRSSPARPASLLDQRSLPIRSISIPRALTILEAHYRGVYSEEERRVVPIQTFLGDVLRDVQVRYFVDLQEGTPRGLASLPRGLVVEWVELVYPSHYRVGSVRPTVLAMPLVR